MSRGGKGTLQQRGWHWCGDGGRLPGGCVSQGVLGALRSDKMTQQGKSNGVKSCRGSHRLSCCTSQAEDSHVREGNAQSSHGTEGIALLIQAGASTRAQKEVWDCVRRPTAHPGLIPISVICHCCLTGLPLAHTTTTPFSSHSSALSGVIEVFLGFAGLRESRISSRPGMRHCSVDGKHGYKSSQARGIRPEFLVAQSQARVGWHSNLEHGADVPLQPQPALGLRAVQRQLRTSNSKLFPFGYT